MKPSSREGYLLPSSAPGSGGPDRVATTLLYASSARVLLALERE